MDPRPPFVTLAASGSSLVAALIAVAAALSARAVTPELVALLVLATGAVVLQAFVQRIELFSAILIIAGSATLAAARLAGNASLVAAVLLVATFLLSVGLRLPPRISLPGAALVLAAHTALGFPVGTTPAELVGVLLTEALVAVGTAALVTYREDVVRTREQLTDLQRLFRNVSAANETLVETLPQMREQSAEAERLRITRELHDSLGYAMTNIMALMNASQYLFDSDLSKVKEYCARTKSLASEAMSETRATLYKLRSVEDNLPGNLRVFFHRLCADFGEATGITTECHPGNLPVSLSARVAHLLLRAVQVGFINAIRHGKATVIRLYFWMDERELRMTIWNSVETRGVADASPSEGIGLRGVRERLAELDGNLSAGYDEDGYRFVICVPREEIGRGQSARSDR